MKAHMTTFVVSVILVSSSYAGVLRNDTDLKLTTSTTEKLKDNSTLNKKNEELTGNQNISLKQDKTASTLLQPVSDNPTVAATRDEGATITLKPILTDEDETIFVVPLETKDGSKILLEASVDLSSDSLKDESEEDVEVVDGIDGTLTKVNKTEALYLFEAPKIESNTNLEDKKQEFDASSNEFTTTEDVVETTTTTPEDQQDLSVVAKEASNSTNDKECSKNVTGTPIENIVVKDTVKDVPNDNVAHSILVEPEVGYIVVETEPETEQFATFTHADSEEHLQPIVQSVEIVPVYVDEYYHSW